MSEIEDFEDSDEGDFSASEDEWKPNKNDDDHSSTSDFEDTVNSTAESPIQGAKTKSVFYLILFADGIRKFLKFAFSLQENNQKQENNKTWYVDKKIKARTAVVAHEAVQ